jgi:hypothetical protein
MKLFVDHFDPKVFEPKLKHLQHLDFSLFIETAPKSQADISPINVISFQEPNEYFGLHDWTIQNKELFQIILTWDDKVLRNTKGQSIFQPFGHTWFKPEQYKIYPDQSRVKEFKVSHLCGKLLKSYGHQMRHEILARASEFEVPLNFYDVYGDRNDIEDARKGKEAVFGNSQYGIAIENFSHRGYFTEKILDCFLLKTVPIYWGCSNIGEFFNTNGIIQFDNVDDLIHQVNILDEQTYNDKITQLAIEENYQKALQYVDYEQNVVNTITTIFKKNNLV